MNINKMLNLNIQFHHARLLCRLPTRLLQLLVLLCFLLGINVLSSSADQNLLNIVYNTGVAPLKFVDESGEPAGLFPEIWRLWGEKNGYDIRFLQAESFAESLEMLKSGEADLHAGLFKTEEREKFLRYSTPLFTLDYYLFTHPAIQTIDRLEQTEGMIVGVQAGGFTEKYIREHIPAHRIAVYPSFKELFSAALKGEIKVFVSTWVSLQYYYNRNRLEKVFNVNRAAPLYSQVYYTATRSANGLLIDEVNGGLSRITEQQRQELEKGWIISHQQEIPQEFAIMLDSEESHYLAGRPTLNVACQQKSTPLEFVSDGVIRGYSVDYLSLLAERMGVMLNLIPAASAAHSREMLSKGDVDVILGSTDALDGSTKHTRPYLRTKLVMLEKNTAQPVMSRETWSQLRIGAVSGSLVHLFLQEIEGLSVTGLADNSSLGMAVNEGKVDVGIAQRVVAENTMQKIDASGIRLVPGVSFLDEDILPLQFSVSRDDTLLLAILNKGIDTVTDRQLSLLKKKWFTTPTSNQLEHALSEEEIAWLRRHPTITMGVDPAFAPFEFITVEGRYSGMASEYMRLIGRRLGVKLEPVKGLSWSEALEKAKKGEIDILPCVGITEERKKSFTFSTPYLQFLRVIMTSENLDVDSLSDLQGQRIGVQRNSSHHGFLLEKGVHSELILFATFEEAMVALSRGKVDAVVGNLAVALYTVRNLSLTELKVGGYASNEVFPLSIGVRKGIPLLTSILNKALLSIQQAEHNEIRKRWVDVHLPGIAKGQSLSLEERAWLSLHQHLKIGSRTDLPPFSFMENGRNSGFSIELIEMLAAVLGIELEHISAPQGELLQLGREKKVDILHTLGSGDTGGGGLLFTGPYKNVVHAIYVHESVRGVRSIEDLDDKRIVMVRGDPIAEAVKKQVPSVEIHFYPNYDRMFEALSEGRGEATVQVPDVARYHIQNKSYRSIKTAALAVLDAYPQGQGFSFAVRHDYPLLLNLLQKTQASLPVEELNRLHLKWFGVEPEGTATGAISLSNQEKNFLSIRKELLFSEADRAPLAIIEKKSGRFEGMIADYLELIAARSGLVFSFAPSNSWLEVLKKYNRAEIDMVPALSQDDNVDRPIILTEPFLSFPLVIVTSNKVSYIGGTGELSGKIVAVCEGFTSHNYLRDNFSQIRLLPKKNVEQALVSVANHQAYAFVGHMAVTIDALQKLGLKNLKIAGQAEYSFDHRIGVSQDHPEVVSIINKVFRSITAEEHRVIYNKWLEVEYAKGVDYGLVWRIGLASALFLCLLFFWNRKLASEVAARKAAEQQLISIAANIPGAIFQAKVTTSAEIKYLFASKGLADYFGVEPDDFIGGRQQLPLRRDDAKRFAAIVGDALAGAKDIEFVGRLKDVEGGKKWVRMTAKPWRNQKKELVYNGLILDVSERMKSELEYQNSERKIMAMSQAVDDGLIMIDNKGRIRFWNKAAEVMFGYGEEEAMGQDFHRLVVPPHLVKSIDKGLKQFGKTGQGTIFGQTQNTTALDRQGREFPAEVTVAPFFVDDQWYAVGTVRDITRRVEDEEALKQHISDLERFERLTVGREVRMIELKDEINALRGKRGESPKYTIVE